MTSGTVSYGAAGVAAKAFGIANGGEKDDRIAAKLNVVLECVALIVGERCVGRVERNLFEGIEWDGERGGFGGWGAEHEVGFQAIEDK